jgi:uncharacterized iron-regulated membrane protein
MKNALLLKLHRWTTITFALPLAAIILTGLVLSFEPMVQSLSIAPGSLDAVRLDALIQQHDPDGKARGLSIEPAAQQLNFQGGPTVDLRTGELAQSRSSLAAFFLWSRRTHERLIGGMGWLVTASTIAMLVVMCIGLLMGLPKLRNSLAGWHKGVAWFTLPLIILSPLTGLFLAFGVTFQSGGAPTRGRPLPLREGARIVAQTHDPSRILSVGPRGGRLLARLDENGGFKTYEITAEGTRELPSNWPRLLHEGNWSSVIGSLLNIITSLALVTLLCTGLYMWASRTLRRRSARSAARDSRETSVRAAE